MWVKYESYHYCWPVDAMLQCYWGLKFQSADHVRDDQPISNKALDTKNDDWKNVDNRSRNSEGPIRCNFCELQSLQRFFQNHIYNEYITLTLVPISTFGVVLDT